MCLYSTSSPLSDAHIYIVINHVYLFITLLTIVVALDISVSHFFVQFLTTFVQPETDKSILWVGQLRMNLLILRILAKILCPPSSLDEQ